MGRSAIRILYDGYMMIVVAPTHSLVRPIGRSDEVCRVALAPPMIGRDQASKRCSFRAQESAFYALELALDRLENLRFDHANGVEARIDRFHGMTVLAVRRTGRDALEERGRTLGVRTGVAWMSRP